MVNMYFSKNTNSIYELSTVNRVFEILKVFLLCDKHKHQIQNGTE